VTERPEFLIAGGGTGGHVFPAVAVAEALRELADVTVSFCGTRRGLEATVVPPLGFVLEALDVEPIQGGGIARAVRGSAIAARATVAALGTLRRRRPRAVLNVGGYASGPVGLAAAILGIPIAVLEPNSVPGLTNRLLGPLARRAYVAWDEAGASFRPTSLRSCGVPLRHGFVPCPYETHVPRRILVMGGSLGAQALNERIPRAIGLLGSLPGLQIVHQTGRGRDAEVRSEYARAGVDRAVVVPFIDDVARAIADADLVVGRAGAVTIAEITTVGRASVLVPFPHAADDHQGKNGEALARAGAAVCLRQDVADPQRLAREIGRLLSDDSARTAMARSAIARGRPNAAQDVARDLLSMVGVPSRPRGRVGPSASLNGATTRTRGTQEVP
jgi:UDP-N-acetylglucosamine--N-acetylmuramyl-(pentapeptide) pyrophosphoryl-undecaprenol N-acetylglucosamine transferase